MFVASIAPKALHCSVGPLKTKILSASEEDAALHYFQVTSLL